MNHEYIHILQYLETGIIGFLLISLSEFIYARFVLKKNFLNAYYYMSTEQEAHRNDENLDYIKNRKFFAVYRYIPRKNKVSIAYKEGKRIIP